PMGRIAKTLVDEGIIVGMSTRGVGTLDGKSVKEDYKLITVDIVADPSAPNCFVEGVLENKEFIVDGDQIVEVAVKNLQRKVEKKYYPKSVSGHVLTYMLDFIEEINRKKS
ncbi:MAG: primosomal protein, partial [Petrotogales bacterium]